MSKFNAPIAVPVDANNSSDGGTFAEAHIFQALSSHTTKLRFFSEIALDTLVPYLQAKHWSMALIAFFVDNAGDVGKRYFLCDNSGSMMDNGGKRVCALPNGNGAMKIRESSRWAELIESISFAYEVTSHCRLNSEFRVLNNGLPVVMTAGENKDPASTKEVEALLKRGPSGQTPICRQIHEIVFDISMMEEQLRAEDKRVCIIISCDGESDDGDVIEALRPLEKFPAWIVVHLCTDKPELIEYWNRVDEALEVDMDVIVNFDRESKEVHAQNPWLTYGEPLHRLREFGITSKGDSGVTTKILDLLDEKPLPSDGVFSLIKILVDGADQITYDPYTQPDEYFNELRTLLPNCVVWDPITSTIKPWVDADLVRAHCNL